MNQSTAHQMAFGFLGAPSRRPPRVEDDALFGALAALPKVDLHRHLTGSLRPGSIWGVAQEYGINLGLSSLQSLQQALVYRSPTNGLATFIKHAWAIPNRVMLVPSAVERFVTEAATDAYEQENVRYLELRVSPRSIHPSDRFDFHPFVAALARGLRAAEETHPIVVRIVLSIPRHVVGNMGTRARHLYYDRILSAAIDYRDTTVVGFDLTGIERGFPPSMFSSFFRRAKDLGFGVTIHAGETDAVQSVREAIDLGATRIGHALKASSHSAVLKLLSRRGVTVEASPTSNVLTSAVRSFEAHPLRRFLTAGVRVAICADNTTVCDVSLPREYYRLSRAFGFDEDDFARMNDHALQASFGGVVARRHWPSKVSDDVVETRAQ